MKQMPWVLPDLSLTTNHISLTTHDESFGRKAIKTSLILAITKIIFLTIATMGSYFG